MSRFLNDLIKLFKRNPEPQLNYVEFEEERANNPLIAELHRQQAERDRTLKERRQILEMAKACGKLVNARMNALPEEDVKFYYLYEGIGAFLPISIKPLLKPWDVIFIPVVNPFDHAEIKYI